MPHVSRVPKKKGEPDVNLAHPALPIARLPAHRVTTLRLELYVKGLKKPVVVKTIKVRR